MINNKNSILNIGSIAFDSIEIRNQKFEKIIGGSATYFSLAASLYTNVYLSAIVGDDFPQEIINLFKVIASSKTFGKPSYLEDKINTSDFLSNGYGFFI